MWFDIKFSIAKLCSVPWLHKEITLSATKKKIKKQVVEPFTKDSDYMSLTTITSNENFELNVLTKQ